MERNSSALTTTTTSSALLDPSYFFSPGQQIVLSVTPVITGALSTLGSACILFIILRNGKRKLQIPYHRLLLGLSTADCINSLRACTSSFVMPSDTPGVWQAHGTQQTCAAQGFFAQLGLSSTLYTGSLALYFLLKIQPHQKGDQWIRKAEQFFHIVPIAYGVATAVLGLWLDLYNPVKLGVGCWVAAYPLGCNEVNSTVTCERGAKASTLVWVFAGFMGISVFILVMVCMVTIYWRVRTQVKIMEQRYAQVSSQQNVGSQASKKLQLTLEQSSLYISSYILTYLFTSTARLTENDGRSQGFFLISFLSAVFYPMQGFMNFFIYARPRYIDLQTRFPHDGCRLLFQRLFEIPVHRPLDHHVQLPPPKDSSHQSPPCPGDSRVTTDGLVHDEPHMEASPPLDEEIGQPETSRIVEECCPPERYIPTVPVRSSSSDTFF